VVNRGWIRSFRSSRWNAFVAIAGAALAVAPAAAEPLAPSSIQLVDATAGSGIDFQHSDGGSGRRYIVESVVAGLALLDFDSDGRIDVYFLNSSPLPGSRADQSLHNRLYRNLGQGNFVEVADVSRAGDTGYGLGVAVADYDEDGFADIYLNNFGANVLYHNNGDGTFSDVTLAANVACDSKVGAGASFFDMDADGDLDLYSANYVDFDYGNHIVRMIGPHQFHPGPKDYRPTPDDLLRNNGDGTFSNVAVEAGVAATPGAGMGVICFDADDDGDPDVFVCNDADANFLFLNDGRGHFEESALTAGVAYNLSGRATSSMGVDCADYDNDGALDLLVTGFSNEAPVLYRNLGGGFFEDATNIAGTGGGGVFAHANWGTGFVDFDNDADRDLFVANGHFMDNIRFIDDRTDCAVPNTLLKNIGGRFIDATREGGDGLQRIDSSRGAGFDDLDNDGRVDAVVLNANDQARLLRNASPAGHWLQVQLRGAMSNRDGVGAKVRVVAGDRAQVAEVHSGRGYQSHFGSRLHFGLGTARHIDRVEVHWPSGKFDVFQQVPTDQRFTLREGSRPVTMLAH